MTGALYRAIESLWHKVLEAPIIGLLLRYPVVLTENDCGICHWWRGAALGAGVAFLLSGHFMVGTTLIAAVLVICALQKIASREGTKGVTEDKV